MTKKSADLLVGELADHFARVLNAVLPAGKLALVDFPDHSNVGDSAIWLGEMAYLRKNNRLPAYHSAIADFDDEACRAAIGDGPLLITGGGNMGTRWPKHEALLLPPPPTHSCTPKTERAPRVQRRWWYV